jgi:hypothetical protein
MFQFRPTANIWAKNNKSALCSTTKRWVIKVAMQCDLPYNFTYITWVVSFFQLKMKPERDSGMITHFLSYISQPRGNMLSALLGSRPGNILVEYHVHNAWIIGAHHWWRGNGFTESKLILVVQDLQECRIALVLVSLPKSDLR